ncbi:ADP-ribosylglycohydrolase family protein [Lysinibacillus fusiformis]|uniref:ADP-ribosylglycohydrolase family protein n=1 Tax=Lysinibacillus fusiformis TaxID=28031 RepID=UPI0030B9F035
MWCVDSSTTFKEAILRALNLGEDTDTVAAITGAIAGMYENMDEIPHEWLDKMIKK